MPSFVCDYCQTTLKKAQLDSHTQRCRMAVFSCIDCHRTFAGAEYRAHTTCITEAQKFKHQPPKPESTNKVQSPPPTPAKIEKPEDAIAKTLKSILKDAAEPLTLHVVKKKLKTKHGKDAKKFLSRRLALSLGSGGEFKVHY